MIDSHSDPGSFYLVVPYSPWVVVLICMTGAVWLSHLLSNRWELIREAEPKGQPQHEGWQVFPYVIEKTGSGKLNDVLVTIS